MFTTMQACEDAARLIDGALHTEYRHSIGLDPDTNDALAVAEVAVDFERARGALAILAAIVASSCPEWRTLLEDQYR